MISTFVGVLVLIAAILFTSINNAIMNSGIWYPIEHSASPLCKLIKGPIFEGCLDGRPFKDLVYMACVTNSDRRKHFPPFEIFGGPNTKPRTGWIVLIDSKTQVGVELKYIRLHI